MGAVVAIGCDVPPDVSVEPGPDGWVVTPHKVPSPLQECFAPGHQRRGRGGAGLSLRVRGRAGGLLDHDYGV